VDVYFRISTFYGQKLRSGKNPLPCATERSRIDLDPYAYT